MDTAPATIDLGQIGPGPDDDAAHLAGSRRHWAAGRALLWWPAALLSVVLVLTSAGSAPVRPWLTPHFTVPAGARFALDGQTLYALDPFRSGRPRTLTAYRLKDGAIRWRTALPVEAPTVVWRDVLLAQTRMRAGSGTVTALDPATGRQLWTRRGSVVGDLGDLLVLRTTSIRRPGTELTVLEGRSGAVRLAFRGGPDAFHWGEVEGVGYLLVRDRDGHLHTHDASNGTRLASLSAGAGVDTAARRVVGDLVLLWGAGPTIHAYDLATLTHRWSTGLAARRYAPAAACGRLVCVGGVERMYALDPDTGEPAWSVDWLSGTDLGEPSFQAGPPWPPGTLLVHGRPRGGDRTQLVDAESGVPVLDLPGWRPQVRPGPLSSPPERHPLLTRYVNRATWFATPGADLSRAEVLGAIDGWPRRNCRTAERYLACQTRSSVRVWRIG